MTGYSVHSGSNEAFASGWDQVFGGEPKPAKPEKKPAKMAGNKATKTATKTAKKKAKKKSARKSGSS